MQDIAQDVIMRAAHGDRDAFEDILRAYGDLVFNVSLRVLRHRQDAEEVSQEVFLTLHKKLRDFEGRSSLKTWIYRITMNVAINYLKRTARMKDKTVAYDDEVLEQEGRAPDVVEKEYTENVIQRLLESLSPEQRACIVLRSIEGLSYQQIAETLGIDINSVRSRLKRAREKMLAMKEEVMQYEL
ncbi:MAG: RNA polymerase sigma factor [Candidatus Omnitrophica bacterium]|nr:RNA polymerase sigma factor [Candidatus Omnitrophota bacterium]